MNLPNEYLNNMKCLLKDDYENWLASYELPHTQGIRLNTTKLTDYKVIDSALDTTLEPVPWTKNGYYIDTHFRPGKHPYFYGGLYYIQEPSAMAPAQYLPIEEGDHVLDLCAAPGGKSTELGAKLNGSGILVANDISNSRAKALLKNLELFGISNICVTSEEPKKLADTFGTFFHKILVDAPCSGEGMFRKDEGLIKSWLEHGPEYFANIQKEILCEAYRMLRPGGQLLYSTCTFSKIEDEDVIHWFINEFPDMKLCRVPQEHGIESGNNGEDVLRFFPHKVRGEGHFIALLQKSDASPLIQGKADAHSKSDYASLIKNTDLLEFLSLLKCDYHPDDFYVKDEQVYLLPKKFNKNWKLRYLRTGLLLGSLKKNRFEPSQALAMNLKITEVSNTLSIPLEDERVIRYLKGETIVLKEETVKKGWCLICVEEFPLGWGKINGMQIKNKYYPGWRWL